MNGKDLTLSWLDRIEIPKLFQIINEVESLPSGIIEKKSSLIKSIIGIIVSDTYEYVFENKEKGNLLIYTHYFYRADHYSTYCKLKDNIYNSSGFFPVKRKRKNNCCKIFRSIKRNYHWISKYTGFRFDKNSLVRLKTLNMVATALDYYLNIDTSKFNWICVYYDVSPIDNAIIQIEKIRNKHTATFQHGMFSPAVGSPTNLNETGIEFKAHEAEYFLAWNKYTKDLAVSTGLDGNKIVVLGIPSYIDISYKKSSSREMTKNIFGVVLNGRVFESDNIELIKIANKIATCLDMKYIVKYHPQYNGNEFDNIVDKKFYLTSCKKYMPVHEYADKVDFTVMTNSSVYIELVYMRKQVYRYVGTGNDKYADIEEGKFITVDELKQKLQSNNDSNAVFDYLCSVENIKESYNSFFSNY